MHFAEPSGWLKPKTQRGYPCDAAVTVNTDASPSVIYRYDVFDQPIFVRRQTLVHDASRTRNRHKAQHRATCLFVETMLAAVEAGRRRRRSVFASSARAVEAHLVHPSTPSLLTAA